MKSCVSSVLFSSEIAVIDEFSYAKLIEFILNSCLILGLNLIESERVIEARVSVLNAEEIVQNWKVKHTIIDASM